MQDSACPQAFFVKEAQLYGESRAAEQCKICGTLHHSFWMDESVIRGQKHFVTRSSYPVHLQECFPEQCIVPKLAFCHANQGSVLA